MNKSDKFNERIIFHTLNDSNIIGHVKYSAARIFQISCTHPEIGQYSTNNVCIYIYICLREATKPDRRDDPRPGERRRSIDRRPFRKY